MTKRLLPPRLHYVEHVARFGSIQRAARELNIAASAIDRHILALEAECGVPLFERLPRGMRPTPAGDAVVTLARRWQSDLGRLNTEINEQRGTTRGHVRIAAMDSLANGLLADLSGRLLASHPAISLELDIMPTDRAGAALINGEVDVAIAFNLAPHREIQMLATETLPFGCIVAPHHALAVGTTTTLQKIATHPLALQSHALMIRRYLDGKHKWLFQDRAPPVVSNSLQLLKSLARAGSHVVLTSQLDAAPELCEGSLVFVAVRDQGAEAQSVSVAIGRRQVTRTALVVANLVAAEVTAALARVAATKRPREQATPER